jgi:hypothetical protein
MLRTNQILQQQPPATPIAQLDPFFRAILAMDR